MNLSEAITQLEDVVNDVRGAASADDITRLPNAFALRAVARLIDAGDSKFGVIVFGDLNRFKGLNDLHGHEAGDVAIYEAGERLRQVVIEELKAQAFRRSGDEFVVLLRPSQLKPFKRVAPSFAAILFEHRKVALKTTMSFGYAARDGKTSFADLLTRAETACRHAKAQGDGVCVSWSDEIQRNPLVNLRDGCQMCGAAINCNVPKQNAPARLISCPCCGEPLLEN